MDIIKVTLTSVLSVVALFVIAKLMGHKQVAQLDFFDYISGITIGSIAAELATELEAPYKPLIALVIYGLTSLALGILTHKFARTRKYINGTPTILLCDGKLYRANLKKAKLDLSEFLLMCREQGYFDLSQIQTAIFEHNGKLSILPRADERPVTPSDMNISVEQTYIGIEVIMDGKVMDENLRRMGRDSNWLETQVKNQGYKNIQEIFLGVYQKEKDILTLYQTN